jgi:tetratricopeptide (TPR) repeat protein
MAIQGSLREASLPDVVQMLHLGRRTGRLVLADRHRHASVFFEDGWITYASIVNRRDRLGEMLVKSGHVTQAQLEEVLAIQAAEPSRRVGELLVAGGVVSPDTLNRFLRIHVEEALYAILTWSNGTFTFEADVRLEAEETPQRFSPDAVLLEGARRIDEWSLIEHRIPSFDLVFALETGVGSLEGLTLTEAQQRVLPLLDGHRDVRAVIDESALSDFTACQALYGLVTAGLVRAVGVSTPVEANRAQEARIEEHRNLGVAFLRTGLLDEAEREFRRVRELRPSEGHAPFALGLIAMRRGDYHAAIAAFREAEDRGGPRPSILANLALALERIGEGEAADAAWAEAARRAPGDGRILLHWGLLALAQGRADLGHRRIEQARAHFGARLPAVWYWAAARSLAAAERYDEALDTARAGVREYPRDQVLANTLAVLLETAGDFEEAERLLRTLLAEDASLPQVSKNLGDLCYRNGRFDQARECYQRAVRLAPSLGGDIYFRLGNLAFRSNDLAGARQGWATAVELNPSHHLARANLDALPGTHDS